MAYYTSVSINDGIINYTEPLNVPAPAPTLSDVGAAAEKVVKLVTSVNINDGIINYTEPLNVPKIEPVNNSPIQIDPEKVEEIKKAMSDGKKEFFIVAAITLFLAILITKK